MLKLLNKEIRLAASPLSFIFIAFSAMVMIPNYPILVGAFFVCLGIFYSYQFGREYNDTLYTALLPVKKSDAVKAKYAFAVMIQLISFAAFALLTVLRMTVLSDSAVYSGTALMQANPVFLAYVLIIFSVFNSVFIGGFFKSAYYVGKPFIAFTVLAFALIVIGETLHHIPGLEALNSANAENMKLQLTVLFCAAVIYIAGVIFSCKGSCRKFDKIDL